MTGKQPLQGLPQTYETKEEPAETLLLTLEDTVTKVEVVLSYTLFRDYPVLTRSASFRNNGSEDIHLNKALSMSIDFPDADFDMIQLPGAWGRERQIVRTPLVRGIHTLDSKRGTTSHAYQPFVALAEKTATEDQGAVYGFHFVYSGEFRANVEVDTYCADPRPDGDQSDPLPMAFACRRGVPDTGSRIGIQRKRPEWLVADAASVLPETSDPWPASICGASGPDQQLGRHLLRFHSRKD